MGQAEFYLLLQLREEHTSAQGRCPRSDLRKTVTLAEFSLYLSLALSPRDLRSFYSFLGNIFLRNEFMFTFLFVLEVSQAALLV